MPYRKAEIRAYQPEDEPLLFGLASMAFGDRPGWSDRRTISILELDQVFVAEVDRSPAGYVALDAEVDAVRIEQLFVAPEHEGEGVGRQLLSWAEGYATSVGARRLEAVVESDNHRALSLYRGYGFAPGEANVLELVLPQR